MSRFRKRGDKNNKDKKLRTEFSINSDMTVIKNYKGKISTLESKNRTLQYILAIVFIINLIFVYFY